MKNKKLLTISSILAVGVGIFLFRYLIKEPFSQTTANTMVTITHSEAALGITPQPDGTLCPLSELSNSSWEDTIANPPASSGVGFAIDLPSASTIGFNTYNITPDTALNGTFHLFYPNTPANSQPVKLRYMIIFDEHQIAAFKDETGFYHDITLQPGEQASLSLQLPSLSAGIHELIVVGLVDTGLNNEGAVTALPFRVTLVAGDHTPFPIQTYQLLKPDVYPSGDRSYFFLGLHSDQSQHIWVWPEVYKKAQSTLDFYVSVGYGENSERLAAHGISLPQSPFAILGFLNSKQIAMSSETNNFYGVVTPDNVYSFIPISLQTSTYHGKGDLLVLRVNYPRLPMCWILQSTSEGTYFDSRVYAMRVGVEFDN